MVEEEGDAVILGHVEMRIGGAVESISANHLLH